MLLIVALDARHAAQSLGHDEEHDESATRYVGIQFERSNLEGAPSAFGAIARQNRREELLHLIRGSYHIRRIFTQ